MKGIGYRRKVYVFNKGSFYASFLESILISYEEDKELHVFFFSCLFVDFKVSMTGPGALDF